MYHLLSVYFQFEFSCLVVQRFSTIRRVYYKQRSQSGPFPTNTDLNPIHVVSSTLWSVLFTNPESLIDLYPRFPLYFGLTYGSKVRPVNPPTTSVSSSLHFIFSSSQRPLLLLKTKPRDQIPRWVFDFLSHQPPDVLNTTFLFSRSPLLLRPFPQHIKQGVCWPGDVRTDYTVRGLRRVV